ncbi:MAG: arsenic efflux protein, partial [Clostridia bacterium]|nr:arsenic efflux protein [Clostridia bacterium]
MQEKSAIKGGGGALIGVSGGLLAQCGFSVVATDLYKKRHITVGTLLGVYLATSDEALPIFLANPDKALHILPILGCKFVLGLLVGYLADLIYTKSRKEVEHHHEECEHEPEIHIGCCHHEIEEENHDDGHDHSHCEEPCGDEIEHKLEKRKENLHKYLLHPLVHSLKIFAYVFVINIIFGIIIYYVGEDKMIAFLSQNKYIAPLLSVVIGAIPNCAS